MVFNVVTDFSVQPKKIQQIQQQITEIRLVNHRHRPQAAVSSSSSSSSFQYCFCMFVHTRTELISSSRISF